jgi:predicted permease
MLPLTLMVLQLAAPSNGGENGSKVLLVGRSLLHAVKQPLVWLPVIGAMLAIAGVHLPDLIDNAVEQVGQAAGGVALFILGLMLAQNPVRLGRDVWLNIGLKNLVQPAIILGAALALRLDPTLTKEVFLIGVMPTAIEASVVAERYGAYVHEAAATAAASTFFSIISISLGLSIAAAL